jgi:RND family efflux transporter MFP subunit
MMRWLRVRGCAAVFGVLCGFPGLALADQAPPVPVEAVALRPAVWRASISLAAEIAAGQSAALAAERPGRVVGVNFSSGQTVPAGTVLVQLDDAPEAAQLALDGAKLTEANNALAREEKLMTIAGASRAALEQAEADAAEARAEVAYDQAVISELRIAAPFPGTLGIRNVSAGDYIAQGQVVAQITQAAPLRVLFSIPQTEGAGIAVGDAFSFKAPSLTALAAGEITALSPAVNSSTNARDAEGKILAPPPAGLLPGMFGTVTLETGLGEPAFTVPPSALNDSALGPFLFVLDRSGADYTLRTVYVTKLGDGGAESYIAADGLQAGQFVLAIGGFKMTDGASVKLESP